MNEKEKGKRGGNSKKTHRILNGRVNAEHESVRTTAREAKNKEQQKCIYIERGRRER